MNPQSGTHRAVLQPGQLSQDAQDLERPLFASWRILTSSSDLARVGPQEAVPSLSKDSPGRPTSVLAAVQLWFFRTAFEHDQTRRERALSSQAVLYGRSETKQQAAASHSHGSGQLSERATPPGRPAAVRGPLSWRQLCRTPRWWRGLDPTPGRCTATTCCRGGQVRASGGGCCRAAADGPHPARPVRGGPRSRAAPPGAGGASGSPAGTARGAQDEPQRRANARPHTDGG